MASESELAAATAIERHIQNEGISMGEVLRRYPDLACGAARYSQEGAARKIVEYVKSGMLLSRILDVYPKIAKLGIDIFLEQREAAACARGYREARQEAARDIGRVIRASEPKTPAAELRRR